MRPARAPARNFKSKAPSSTLGGRAKKTNRKRKRKVLPCEDFLRSVRAAVAIGDNRRLHIQTYRRLIEIIDDLETTVAVLQQDVDYYAKLES